jgi:hypothetical protein
MSRVAVSISMGNYIATSSTSTVVDVSTAEATVARPHLSDSLSRWRNRPIGRSAVLAASQAPANRHYSRRPESELQPG